MKRCPECNSSFPDAEHFCEVDGTPLVQVDEAANPLPVDRTGVVPRPQSSGSLLLIGTLAGILLGILLVLVYFAMSRQRAQENSNTTSSGLSAQQQESFPPLKREPPATATPSLEPSVEPSASPSETPSPQSTQIELSSSNPISTAPKGRSDPVRIKLNSSATIEADEAWQTGEGIWYRKNTVVSLLDPKNVKAIEKVAPAAPQPSAAATPSP